MATRRQFSREFKLEAVKLVKERGVALAQATRDLDLHETVLRSWIRELAADPQQAFPGKGVMKPEQAELERPSTRPRCDRMDDYVNIRLHSTCVQSRPHRVVRSMAGGAA